MQPKMGCHINILIVFSIHQVAIYVNRMCLLVQDIAYYHMGQDNIYITAILQACRIFLGFEAIVLGDGSMSYQMCVKCKYDHMWPFQLATHIFQLSCPNWVRFVFPLDKIIYVNKSLLTYYQYRVSQYDKTGFSLSVGPKCQPNCYCTIGGSRNSLGMEKLGSIVAQCSSPL